MPYAKLTLKPGVNLEETQTLNEGGFSFSQLIRFFAGLPQKLGGWQRYITATVTGICRALFGWSDLNGNPYLAIGTNLRLQVVEGGLLFDITPLQHTSSVAVAFSTVSGSAVVTIADATYSPAVSDVARIVIPVSVGGLLIQGDFPVTTVVDGTHYQITAATPATSTVTNGGAVPSFTTTNTSATVAVALANHGLSTGQPFTVQVATAVGGITLSGLYVVTVTGAGTFTIPAASPATSSATASENGGDVEIEYLLPGGPLVNTVGGGWGSGTFGSGLWGGGTSGPYLNPMRLWSLDNFGQDLIASPTLGGIYFWQPPVIVPAQIVDATAPTINTMTFCMPQVQMVVAVGSSTSGTHFPTLVRWCDAGDFTDWTPTAANQAGSFQIPTGSACISALAIGLEALIWTDIDLWSMTYQGLPFVFGFNRVGTACEAISQKAPAVVANGVMWPSDRQMFRYDGSGVRPFECPVWDFFYTTFDQYQKNAIFSAVNTLFNEVAWFFPIATSVPAWNAVAGTMGYVKYNYLEAVWDYGSLDRTAWVDHSPLGPPIGCSTPGVLYQHEVSTDADGSPLVSSITTGYFDIQAGTDYAFMDVIIPDFSSESGYTVQFTVFATDYPGQTPRVYGPYSATPGTTYINTRVRGRQVAIQISSSDLGSFWRLGAVRYRFAPSGRR